MITAPRTTAALHYPAQATTDLETDCTQSTGVGRLLAVNLNYLGDALFTTPALSLLHESHQGGLLDVLAGQRAATVLSGAPGVARLLTRPPHGGMARATTLWRVLRQNRYDGVVLFQSTLLNAALTWAARVPIRVGFELEGCGPLLTHPVTPRKSGEHIVDAYLRLAEAWQTATATATRTATTPPPGTASFSTRHALEDSPRFPLSIQIGSDERAFADDFMRQQELTMPTVGLVIGATRPQKRWPEEYFARLADRLWNGAGIACVLLGGPEEAESAQRIMHLARAPLVSSVGRTTEKQLAALLTRLAVVVSGDSGPLHIATAVETPVVALFGSTDPDETGPWPAARAPQVVLYDGLACAPCRKTPTCDGRFDCLRGLTPERVLEAVYTLLPQTLPMIEGAGQTLGRRHALPVVPVISGGEVAR